MINKVIYEDGNGGSLLGKNNNIEVSMSLSTIVYIKLFGGQVREDKKVDIVAGELNDDWWGNDLNEDETSKIKSQTEYVLKGASLTSRSIKLINNAVKSDLKSIEKYGKIDVNVTSPKKNRVQIDITITRKNKVSEISYTWDATLNEVITETTL